MVEIITVSIYPEHKAWIKEKGFKATSLLREKIMEKQAEESGQMKPTIEILRRQVETIKTEMQKAIEFISLKGLWDDYVKNGN